MSERLQKALAAAGIASRRAAEALIESGDVTVNGAVARLGQSIDRERDRIEVRGRPVVFAAAPVYLALNKPPGYVTSLRSTHGEATVMDLLGDVEGRVFPAGRLDKETSGLLLLTDDGEWANIVTHPRYEVEKEYEAVVRGRPSRESLERLRGGMRLPDGAVTAPARVEDMGAVDGNGRLSVTVIEGKKRQIRLMAEAIGHPVVRLRRVRIGPIELTDLSEGHARPVTPAEVEGIRAYGRRASARGGAPEPAAGGD